jgi:hypothetical protein
MVFVLWEEYRSSRELCEIDGCLGCVRTLDTKSRCGIAGQRLEIKKKEISIHNTHTKCIVSYTLSESIPLSINFYMHTTAEREPERIESFSMFCAVGLDIPVCCINFRVAFLYIDVGRIERRHSSLNILKNKKEQQER